MAGKDSREIKKLKSQQHNYAFIDGQNLHMSVKNQGWVLDYKRFRRYLTDKYKAIKSKRGIAAGRNPLGSLSS
ncbi:MAG: hypothetical protein CEE38_00965 [Planctomycetes bacterium B3_Pla]|nr:MAG: hypothetical protein CEE38_00965 [Planctomycetes bacterium B3_Pla]